MAKGDLEIGLLHQMLVLLGTLRDRPVTNPPSAGELMPLIRDQIEPGPARLTQIQRHVNFLIEKHFVEKASSGLVYRNIKLTAKGQAYVQPELADFGERSILPDVIKSVEERVAILTYPEAEKQGTLYELRKAVADKAPDMIAKVIIEIGTKLMQPGG